MKTLSFLLCSHWLLAPLFMQAQTAGRPINGAWSSTGAYSLHHTDVFSFTGNTAALAQLKNPAAGMSGERQFLLNDLGHYTLVAGIVTSSGNFGVKASYAGSADFNETTTGLAYARKLGTKADVGVQFNYHSIRISSGYGQASAISAGIGLLLHLSEKLHAGIHVANPVGGKFGADKQEKIPSVYTVGMGYEVAEKFFISAEVEKENEQPVNINAGMEYRFVPQVMVRAGISSATSSPWFGAGLMLKSFRLDVITSYHPQLGLTPGLQLLFNFKRKEK